MGKDIWFLGGKIGEEEGGRNFERKSLVNSLVLGNSHRDTIVVGNLGLGDPETARIPGDRES